MYIIILIVVLYLIIQNLRWYACYKELQNLKRVPRIDLILSWIFAMIWPFDVRI